MLDRIIATNNGNEYTEQSLPAYVLMGNIEYLQYKYKTFPSLAALNIAEYLEYQDVKDIQTEELRGVMSVKQQEFYPPVQYDNPSFNTPINPQDRTNLTPVVR